jgi:integrase
VKEREWISKRGDSKRFAYTWTPDPAKPKERKQKLLPTSITSRVQAERYVDEHRAELQAEKAEAPKPKESGLTVAEVAALWEKHRKADSRRAWSTITDNISHLKKHIVPMLGNVVMNDLAVDVPACRRWVRALTAKGLAPYTCRNIVSTLASMFEDAAGEGWIKFLGNPARADAVRSELPDARPRAGRSQKVRTTLEYAQALLDCEEIPLVYRVIYALVVTSGLRAGEIFGLTVGRSIIDAVPPRFEVERASQLKSRKGHAAIGDTKTKGSVRTMPWHPAAFAAVQEWLRVGWEPLVTRSPGSADLLFPRADGEPWRPKMAKIMRGHLALIGAPTAVDGHPLTFHGLRGLFATTLRAEGVPHDERASLMGHTPKGAGDKHYTEADLRKLVEFVGRIKIEWRTR